MTVFGPTSRPSTMAGGVAIAAAILGLTLQAGSASRATVASRASSGRAVHKVSATRSFSSRSAGQAVRGCFIGLKKPIHIVVVDKSAQKLHLYRHGKTTTLVKTYPCATGENPGHKVVEGDHRTPEGVYFFIRVYRDSRMTIFGKQAWHLNYPNPVDRLRGRRGNGIYIHGLNKKLTPRSTKGCIALRQSDLDHLSRYLHLYRTPVVVTSRLKGQPRFHDPESCRQLRAIVKANGRALRGQPAAAAAAIYTPRHLNRDLRPLDVTQATNLAPKKIRSSRFGLIRFLNQTHVWFLQELAWDHGRRAKVWRRLTYLDRGGRPGLLASEWRPLDRRLLALAGRPPVPVASRTTPAAPLTPEEKRRHQAAVSLVAGWRRAWQDKDLAAYIAFYDRSFRAQGMNRAQWKKYKGGLNRRYRFIQVKVSGLRVSLAGTDRALATFHQSYRSNYFHSRSLKTLELIERDGQWRIRREESGRRARALRLAVLRRMVAVKRPPAKVASRTTPPAKPAPAVKKTTPAKKAVPAKVAPPVKKTPPAKVAPAVKKTTPVKKAVPAKTAPPVKKKPPAKVAARVKIVRPIKPAPPVKKVVPVKKISPVKKAAPARPAPAVKKAPPEKPILSPEVLLPPATTPQKPPPARAASDRGQRGTSVTELIKHWRLAWQNKDLASYMACYDRSFRAQGMNRAQWKKYKGRLNRRYRFIRVRVSRLRIRLKGRSRARATFHLSYRSNYFHSRGVKTLELVKRRGRWRIRRETFQRRGG